MHKNLVDLMVAVENNETHKIAEIFGILLPP